MLTKGNQIHNFILCVCENFSDTVIWGKTGRVKNFKVILKIFRKCFLEFFFSK
jgi:hypothetical protein